MNYKRTIFICLSVLITAVLIFVSIYLYFFTTTLFRPTNAKYINSSYVAGEYISEDKVYDEINRILLNYSMSGNISIIKNKYDAYTTFDNENENGMVIRVDTFSSTWVDITDYKEIEALMDICLFVEEYRLPFDIIGVSFWFKEGGQFTSSLFIPLSKTEFGELYKDISGSGLSLHEKVKYMAEKWIKEVGYNRQPGIAYKYTK